MRPHESPDNRRGGAKWDCRAAVRNVAWIHGVFLADPELLDAVDGGPMRDRDLLQVFSETDAGDRALGRASPRGGPSADAPALRIRHSLTHIAQVCCSWTIKNLANAKPRPGLA